LFLVFDIEVAFLLPWVLGGVSTGYYGFTGLVFFLVVLVVGFVYEFNVGRLDWN
jgi:NADH-quinone oxidoreductase subunit A